MSWVANFKRRVSSNIYRSSTDPPIDPELKNALPTSLSPLPESFQQASSPKTTKFLRLEALVRSLANPLKEGDNIKYLRDSVLAFNEVLIDGRKSQDECIEDLEDLDCLPEFVFAVAGYLFNQISIFEEENIISEDASFLFLAFSAFRHSIQYQPQLIKSLTHTNLPRKLLDFNRFFLANETSKKQLDVNKSDGKSGEGDDSLQGGLDTSISILHQNITLTLGLLLLDNNFVKDIVLKGLAFDFFSTFLTFPEESGSELTGCAIRNASDRPNGLLSFLSSKGFMNLCCKKLKTFVPITLGDQGKLMRVVRLVNDIIEESSRKNIVLANDFRDSGGYDILTELLVTGPFEGRCLDAKQFIISALENLVFVGPELSKDQLLSLAGVDDEMGEPASPHNGPSLRNPSALAPLIFCLLHPNLLPEPLGLNSTISSHLSNGELPNNFREAILVALINLACISHVNYLVINGHRVTQRLLEEFHLISYTMQEMVMKLLTQSIQRFHHYPVKELSLIPYCLEDSAKNPETLKLLYDTFSNLVARSDPIKTIAKEIGILDSFLSHLKACLCDVQAQLSESSPETDAKSQLRPELFRKVSLLPHLLSAITVFIQNDVELAIYVSDRFSLEYFSFLIFEGTREPFLNFLEGQMRLLCSQTNFDQDFQPTAPSLFSRFIGFLDSQRECLSLTLDCLDFLLRFLKDDRATQISFAKEGGFSYVLAVLSDLKGLISSSRLKHFLLLQKVLLVLVLCICKNSYTQRVFVNDISVATFLEHLDATDIFETLSLQPIAFGFLFGLVLGEADLLDVTFAEEVARLPEQLLFGTVRCPDLIPALFHFTPKLGDNPILEKAVLNGLWSIINGSVLNQIYFSQQDVAVNLLYWNDALLARKDIDNDMLHTMTEMLHCLLELGANDINLLKLLRGTYNFTKLDSLEILQVGLERGIGPPMFHFDCDADYPPSVTLPNVVRSSGFVGAHSTLLWVQVVRLPEEGSLPLLRFLSNNSVGYELLLGTDRTLSIKCSGASAVSFLGEPLQEEVWNHVVLVHTKAMLSIAGSNIALYLNGRLAESKKISYSLETLRPEGTLVLGDTDPSSSAVWNLGPVSILDEALDASTVDSIYQLGPVYFGNFQDGHLISTSSPDALKSSFQLLPRDSKTYDAGCLVPRDRLVVSLRPRDLVLRNDTSQQLGAPNQRYNRLEFAVANDDGVAWLSQGVSVALSPHLAMDLWKVGGCALLLKLIADATDISALERALSILALALRNNPRFGAEMVRIKGYDILGFLLKKKADLAEPSLVLLLRGLSIDLYERHPCIQNATAFQCLVLDFEVWKGASTSVQSSVVGLIKDLLIDNPHMASNLEVLNDLDAVKRLLFALRYDHFQRSLFPNCIDAIRCLLVSSYTQENIRLLVAFITSTLSRDGKPGSPVSATYRIDRASIITDARTVTLAAHHLTVGNAALKMLHDLLQEDSNCAKLASMITSKWLLLLYSTETNPYSVILATRILARLFLLGPSFITKFRSSHFGFAVLSRVLPKWWFLPQLYHALIAMLLGVNVDSLPIGDSFDFFSLVSLVSHDINTNKELAIEATVILFHMIKCCLSACLLLSTESQLRSRDVSMAAEFSPLTRKTDEDYQNAARISRVVQTLLQFVTELHHTSKRFRVVCCHSLVANMFAETLALFSEGYNEFPASRFDVSTQRSPQTLESEGFSTRTLGQEIESSPREVAPFPLHRRSITLPEKSVSTPSEASSTKNEAVEAYVEFVLTICCNGITSPPTKPLSEVEAILKAPFLGSFEGYTQFTNYFLGHLVKNFKSSLMMNPHMMVDAKALAGITKFCQLCVDSCYQGFFTAGRLEMFDLLSILIQHLVTSPSQSADARTEPFVMGLMKQLNRMILYCLTEASLSLEFRFPIQFLKGLLLQHTNIFSPRNSDPSFWRSFCHHLFVLLQFDSRQMRIATFNIWKLILLMKGQDLQAILQTKDVDSQALLEDFCHMLETDLETFCSWFEASHPMLAPVFAEVAGAHWEETFKLEKSVVQEALAGSRSTLTARAVKQRHDREVEQGAFQKAISMTGSWAKNLQRLETDSYSRLLQDQADSNTMVLMLWKHALSCSALLSDGHREGPSWKLDLTEGPSRMRLRLKPNRRYNIESLRKKSCPKPLSIPTSSQKAQVGRGLTINVTDMDSENNESLDDDGEPSEELKSDSKVHRVLRYLEPEDEVKDIFNIGRVSGLEVADALLLFCTDNVYVVDGYFLCSDGNIVETSEIPANERDTYIQSIAASATPAGRKPTSSHQCRRCAYADLKEVHRRKFLFRNAALEIFFGDGRNLLITTALGQRDTIFQRLVQRLDGPRQPSELTGGAPTEPAAFLGTRLTNMILRNSSLGELTARWERREITNFEYLMHLNTLAGRSYNDLTQYPVFPWVLSDYTSDELDFTNPGIFRDLSKPMGTQSDSRAQEFGQRYLSFSEADDTTPPFHYGTHYSSAMIVCWYLLRLEPFTSHHRALQGGQFDHPDRLFHNIKDAWLSAAFNTTTDVRELIPEFFYLPEFLSNLNEYEFGARQDGGDSINSVVLPPWACGSPELFIRKHREALECDFVSNHLHLWIDLIFGYRQQGPAAVEALNVFHHLSYQDAVDLDKISDPVEKAATIGIINNFGQTPRQLFKRPHPSRPSSYKSNLFDVGTAPHILVQSHLPLACFGAPVSDVLLCNDRLMALGRCRIFLGRQGTRHLEWGLLDNCLQLHQTDPPKLLACYEECHCGHITAITSFSDETFITGSDDQMIKVWALDFRCPVPELTLRSILRGAGAEITVISACSPFGIAVVGTTGKELHMWDVHRSKYIRKMLVPFSGVISLCIEKTSGTIVACTKFSISAWTVNGALLATIHLPVGSPCVTATAFSETQAGMYSSYQVLITGHEGGMLQIWRLEYDSLVLIDALVERLSSETVPEEDILSIFAPTSRQALIVGNRRGEVYSYQFPDFTGTFHRSKSESCCSCSSKVPLPERKLSCAACGGTVCILCIVASPFRSSDKEAHLCKGCYQRYSLAHS